MPGGNGTGPMGQGPMTGRGAGFCAGYAAPGYMNAGRGGFGRGMGMGMGRGFRGRGWMPSASVPMTPAVPMAPTAEQELGALRQQANAVQETLQRINERIEQLESSRGE